MTIVWPNPIIYWPNPTTQKHVFKKFCAKSPSFNLKKGLNLNSWQMTGWLYFKNIFFKIIFFNKVLKVKTGIRLSHSLKPHSCKIGFVSVSSRICAAFDYGGTWHYGMELQSFVQKL